MLGTLLLVLSLAQTPARLGVDARIRFCLEKVSNHPRLYPAYAQLAEAYLEKARDTHDRTAPEAPIRLVLWEYVFCASRRLESRRSAAVGHDGASIAEAPINAKMSILR